MSRMRKAARGALSGKMTSERDMATTSRRCGEGKLLAFVFAASLSVCSGCATKVDLPYNRSSAEVPMVLLKPASDVETACHGFALSGVRCVFPRENWAPDDASRGGLLLSPSDYSLLDIGQTIRVSGFLLLSERKSPAGNPYYTATAKVYKFGYWGNKSGVQTDSYNDEFWREVATGVKYAPESSDIADNFIGRMDRLAAAAREDETRKQAIVAAEKKRQAEDAALKVSPAYIKSQAVARVDGCRKQIAIARAAIAKDERVAQISGYENKLLRESAAQTIVNCQDTIARGGYLQSERIEREANPNMPTVVHYRLDGIE
ncbi:hypothetical protein BM43_3175 [Burkholderia gladioli]|nr:hypothetical protein BM43_3175 [Burkholderia gladioli]SPV21792.1 Uncharacterised protein [Burkholderia gladioli]